MQNYHRLFLVSQERYDKLVNLASSGGGQAMKVRDTHGPTKGPRETDILSPEILPSNIQPVNYTLVANPTEG